MRPPPARPFAVRIAPIAAALALLALASGCPFGRGIEASKLLNDIAESQADPGAPIDGTMRLAVAAGGAVQGDLYLPARGEGDAARPLASAAALVLVPGLAETGKDDPRVVALARTLARSHIAVLVPDIASLKQLRAGPENVREIADALRYLGGDGRTLWTRSDAAAEAAASTRPVGVAAVSYAVGPALLATLEPDLAGRVAFLVGIGGYYDMTAALTFATTGWYRDAAGAWHEGEPNAYGEWAFVLANAGRVTDARDRTSLHAMARRRLRNLAAPIDDLADQLGPEGRAIYAFVTNEDRAKVPALLAALPAAIRADMAALDLSGRDLAAAPPHVLLIHGRDDPIIPASESAALAAALGPGRAELILLDSLTHADLGLDSAGDGFRLWQATYWILSLRDGAR